MSYSWKNKFKLIYNETLILKVKLLRKLDANVQFPHFLLYLWTRTIQVFVCWNEIKTQYIWIKYHKLCINVKSFSDWALFDFFCMCLYFPDDPHSIFFRSFLLFISFMYKYKIIITKKKCIDYHLVNVIKNPNTNENLYLFMGKIHFS